MFILCKLGDRLIEETRPIRREMRTQRQPNINAQTIKRPSERSARPSRIHEKPYSRPMAMDYDDSMEWEEANRYSPSPVNKLKQNNYQF